MVSNSGTMLTASDSPAQQADFLQQDARLRAGRRPTGISRSRSSAAPRRRSGDGCPRRSRSTAQLGTGAGRNTRDAANAGGAGSRARAASSAIRSRSAKRCVVGRDAGARQELGDHRLVHVRVLAQVEHREVKAEHFDRADQRHEPSGRRAVSRRAARARRRSRAGRRGARPAFA